MTQTRLTGIEYLRAVQRARDATPLPATFSGLWSDDGKLRAEYQDHRPARRIIIRYAERANGAVPRNLRDELPPGVRQALQLGPDFSQMRTRYPWSVRWVRLREGKRVVGEKRFQSLAAAIYFWYEYKPQVSNMTICSRLRSYDIPPSLRGRLPKGWCWCPRCMVPRRFQRHPEDLTFTANKKYWSNEKGRYVWRERTLTVLQCPMCGTNNRDPAWRRSNQPWEIRRVKRRKRRAKR